MTTKERVRVMLEASLPGTVIAERLGISRQRVSQIKADLGMTMNNTRPGRWKPHAGRPDPRPSVRARAKPRKFYETERVACMAWIGRRIQMVEDLCP